MPNRETLNPQAPGRPNPNVLAPGDDETLEPGQFTGEEDEVDPGQADQIPKVGAGAQEEMENDASEDDDADESDDAVDEDEDEDEDDEVEDGSGGHV